METILNIIVDGDKILLARKKRGFGAGKINSPGGKLEPGETIKQAMIRETQEEVGIIPTKFEYVGVITYDEYFKGEKTVFDCHLFLTTKWQGNPQESDEMNPMWVDKKQIPYDEMFGDDLYWLPQVLNGEKVKCFFKFDKDFKMIEYKVGKLYNYFSYKDILQNKQVTAGYEKIDAINPYPFNHGLKHINNVCKIASRLCDKLGVDEEIKNAVLIACALHDIGQVDGREEHGKKSKNFALKYFENELKTNKYFNDILSAIEMHDNTCNIQNSLFTLIVQFCDKMDFSKERLEKNYREKFRYYCYEDIIKIDFVYSKTLFGINIITNKIDGFIEMFLHENFPKKVFNAVEVLALKLGKKSVYKHNGKNFIVEIS